MDLDVVREDVLLVHVVAASDRADTITLLHRNHLIERKVRRRRHAGGAGGGAFLRLCQLRWFDGRRHGERRELVGDVLLLRRNRS